MERKKFKPVKRYKYKQNDDLVYLGAIYPEYKGQECKVVDRTAQKGEFYIVRFPDRQEHMVTVKALRKKNEQLNFEF